MLFLNTVAPVVDIAKQTNAWPPRGSCPSLPQDYAKATKKDVCRLIPLSRVSQTQEAHARSGSIRDSKVSISLHDQ
jgi:hypothetical protein